MSSVNKLNKRLLLACNNADIATVRDCIAKGASVQCTDETQHNWTPLQITVTRGDEPERIEIARLLLENKANVNCKGHYDGPNNNNNNNLWDRLNSGGNTPLHVACKTGRFEYVKLLIQHGADVTLETAGSETPLGLACSNRHLQIAEYLLLHGKADPNGGVFQREQPPLHIACFQQHLDMIDLLLRFGADINRQENLNWFTVLHKSSMPLPVIRHLLSKDGIRLDVRDHFGYTPLHRHCFHGRPEVVTLLLEHESAAGVLNAKDKYGNTPLHCAFQCHEVNNTGTTTIVNLLLGNDVILVNSQNDDGNTPLITCVSHKEPGDHMGGFEYVHVPEDRMAAWKRERCAVLETLLRDNRTNANATNNNGMTALCVASSEGRLYLVETLLEHGRLNVNHRDPHGMTPLHWACDWFIECPDVVKCLLAHGADPNAATTRVVHDDGVFDDEDNDKPIGTTPLHLACRNARYGQVETIRHMLAGNANTIAVDKNGRTPLHISARCGHLAVVQCLLTKTAAGNAHIAAINHVGSTPLDEACRAGHLDVVYYLLREHGVALDLFNANQQQAKRS